MTFHPALYVKTPRQDRIAALTDKQRAAQRNVTWEHYRAMLDQGIPGTDLVHGGLFTFGVVTVMGREMLVTEDRRLRGYLSGPGLFKMPQSSSG